VEARIETRRLRPHAEDVWSATFILLGLRYSRELARQLLRGVRSMKESVTYQAILEEGAEKGALAEARKFVLRQGRVRFGPPDARVPAALEAIDCDNPRPVSNAQLVGADVHKSLANHTALVGSAE
jgi:hypothetical protein